MILIKSFDETSARRFFLELVVLLLLAVLLSLAMGKSVQAAGPEIFMAKGGAAGGCADNCSGAYGVSTQCLSQDQMSADYFMMLTEVPVTCSGSNPTIHGFVVDPNLGTPCNMKFIIYDSDGASGEPGTRLFTGSSNVVDDTGNEISEATTTICLNTSARNTLWIGAAFTLGGGSSASYYYNTNVAAKLRTKVHTDFTPPDTWDAAGDTHVGREISFWLSW